MTKERKVFAMQEATSSHELAEECIFTALSQLMEHKPFQEITITDITKKAGVSRMAYYRNYQSKEEILTRRLDMAFQSLLSDIRSRPDLSEHEFWKFFFARLGGDRYISLMVRAGLFEVLLQYHQRYSSEIFLDFFHWKFDNEYDRLLFLYHQGGITNMVKYIIENPDAVDQDVLIQVVEHCFVGSH